MKVNDFIETLKTVEKMATLYKLGTFCNKTKNGYLLSDCSGLIKGILWGYPKNGKYGSNGVPDVNANTMIKKCKNISSDFKNISSGEMVWLQGHCGVYIGNGKVIESSPRWENGVQITKLSDRKWLKHGFLPWVEYSTTSDEYYVYKGNSNSLVDALKSIGVDSSFTNRVLIAYKNGINSYSGTYSQNVKLLTMLKNGKLKK